MVFSDYYFWSPDHSDCRAANFTVTFKQVYWPIFNVYKAASSSNEQLEYNWSYFLDVQISSPRCTKLSSVIKDNRHITQRAGFNLKCNCEWREHLHQNYSDEDLSLISDLRAEICYQNMKKVMLLLNHQYLLSISCFHVLKWFSSFSSSSFSFHHPHLLLSFSALFLFFLLGPHLQSVFLKRYFKIQWLLNHYGAPIFSKKQNRLDFLSKVLNE